MKDESANSNAVANNLKKIFTKGQINKLKGGKKRIVWSSEDISSAIALHSSGSRCYRYMYRKGFPLPGPSTLRARAAKLKLKPGILTSVLDLMKRINYSEFDKVCILSFDEMKIRSCYEYDKVNDTVMSPSKYVQVAVIRGLFKKWMQPIYYNFDSPMTVEILMNIIKRLEEINFTVVAIISDLGPTNTAVRRDLNISEEKPYFIHPSDKLKKIFVFADVPHLIKLLRNHFVDSGFIYKDKVITTRPIAEIIQVEKSDLKISFKVNSTHLEVAQASRQKVKFATQLFSNSVSSCIKWCVANGKCKSLNALQCAEFIKTVNDWFDIFNSRVSSSSSIFTKKAYGLEYEKQKEVLNNVTQTIKNLRVINRKNLLPFQKAIINDNVALDLLFQYLKTLYNTSYIITNRLNQDILENFFGIIRSKGGLNDHPTAIEFKYRLRSFILGITLLLSYQCLCLSALYENVYYSVTL